MGGSPVIDGVNFDNALKSEGNFDIREKEYDTKVFDNTSKAFLRHLVENRWVTHSAHFNKEIYQVR